MQTCRILLVAALLSWIQSTSVLSHEQDPRPPIIPGWPNHGVIPGWPQGQTYDWRTRRPILPSPVPCHRCFCTRCRCGGHLTYWYPPIYRSPVFYGYAVPFAYPVAGYYGFTWAGQGFGNLPGQFMPQPVLNAPWVAPMVNQRPVANVLPAAVRKPQETIAVRAAKFRPSLPTARQRADLAIAAGDNFFESQSSLRAQIRYLEAIKIAPDYPRARFRLAHAQVAQRKYSEALTEFLLALELAKAGVEQPGFQLSQLYGGVKNFENEMDILADAAINEPENGGLSMLVGLTLYYDQQLQRAEPFFRQAAETTGEWQVYAKRFLNIDNTDVIVAPK